MSKKNTVKMTSTGSSSAKYGLCEICGEHVSEVWMRSVKDSAGYYVGRHAFGHAECLKVAK